ncbi:hypothetical protein GWI33_004827 [Rhynchophorus ferrugineus]|uniref:C2H2-type domain-containing protein n=1 Tax=Rhynchophorus ferrugineus TaxID=354439 RepID=A0A834MGG7_RHYFE|nr:hypothetical protein GWI33_004827 [Rhynchophorus ferrugineus]
MVNSGSFTSDSDRSGKTNYQQISDATNVSQSADSGDATDVASKTECSKTADNDDQPHVEPAQSANDEPKRDVDDSKGLPSVPGPSTDIGEERTKTPRKMLCLYCERSFVSANLRQKHVERAHSTKPNRRVSARRQNQLSTTPCGYCDKLNNSEHTLSDLFRHYVQQHSTRYFGCLTCEDRFLTLAHLSDHNSAKHQLDEKIDVNPAEKDQFVGEGIRELTRGRVRAKMEEVAEPAQDSKRKNKVKDVRGKKIGVKTSKIALKRSKRLQAQAKEMEMQKKRRDRKHANNHKTDNGSGNKQQEKAKSACVNPYPEFDSFYRVKKITDHSIDNLKISSLTFDDVFDKAFFNRIKCNIEENLLHHIDGKLFKNEESESRISNFEKEVQNGNQENYGCELSLNAITPVASLSLNSQFGEDFESQIEYGAKPSKKKSQSKSDEVHYKYFTRRKYQASILQQKENRDLSKLDMWTQMVVKERQERMANNKKSQKEIDEYTAGHEYKNKIKREELNRILDRRGPFEDLKEELSKKAAFDKLNLSSGSDVSQEVFTDVREVINDILNRVYEATKEDDVLPELDGRGEVDHRQIPSYLDLRRKDWSAQEEIDRSDRIALICSSQETENFEMPTNKIRPRNELVELTGEWARSRMYICAACGGKFSNMKYLLDHKNLYHQNVWVQHYEFVGNQSELYRHLSIPALGKVGVVEETVSCKQWKRSESRTCAKCAKQCNSLGELHRHVLECGGDWTWMLARKKCKYRPFGAKSRRKRKGLVRRTSNKQKTDPPEKKTLKKPLDGPRQRPSDADTIQRMLANLPAKRSRRSLISLRDVVFKSRKTKERNASQSKKCTKQATTTSINGPRGAAGGNSNAAKSVRNLNKVLSSRILDFNSSLLVKRKLKNMQQGRKSTGDDSNTSTKGDASDKRKSPKRNPRPEASPGKTKTLSRKILTSRLNIKNFFPIRKKSMETVYKGSESAEGRVSPRNKKKHRDLRAVRDSDYVSKLQHLKTNKKGGLKGFVRALSLRKRNSRDDDSNQVVSVQSDTKTSPPKKNNRVKIKIIKPGMEPEEKTDVASTKKRKLHRRVTEIINKVKKSKTEKKMVQDQPFLEEKGVISEPLPEKTVVTPAEVRDSIIAKKDRVPIVPMPDTKENPPIPETIFNLTNSEEKSLQAKGQLDFDRKSQTPLLPLIMVTTEVMEETKEDVKVDQMNLMPMVIDTNLKSKSTPMSSPNMKGKIKKPNRGLNDCIAMLTSKLQLKKEKTSSLDSLFGTSSTVTAEAQSQEHHQQQSKLQKTECILKIPTFRATKSPVIEEETALDLSKKSYTSTSPTDLKPDTIENTINKVIEGVIEHKCKEVLTEKLAVPTWATDMIQTFQTSPSRRSNKKTNFTTRTHVDDTIDFVVNSSSTWYDNKTAEVKIAPSRRTRRKKNSDDNLIKDIIFGKDKLIIAPSSNLQEMPLIARIKENEIRLQFKKISEAIRRAVGSTADVPEAVIGEDAKKSVNEICDNIRVSYQETIPNESSCQLEKSTIFDKEDTCCDAVPDPDNISEEAEEEPKINEDKEETTPIIDTVSPDLIPNDTALATNDLIPNKSQPVNTELNQNNDDKLGNLDNFEINEPVKEQNEFYINQDVPNEIPSSNQNITDAIEIDNIVDRNIHINDSISQTVEPDPEFKQLMSTNDRSASPIIEKCSNKKKTKSKKNGLGSADIPIPEDTPNCILPDEIISKTPTSEIVELIEQQPEVETNKQVPDVASKFSPSESDDDLPLAALLKKNDADDEKVTEPPVDTDDSKENHQTEDKVGPTLSDISMPVKKKQKKTKTVAVQDPTKPVECKTSDDVPEDGQQNPSESLKDPVQEPIKILINAQRTRRKSKSSKKLDKTDNDLFKDFSLVINKKTKRIPPFSIVDDSVCDDILDTSLLTKLATDNIRKTTEPCLNDSVEEMDMEIEDIPINASIIERNEVQGHNTAETENVSEGIIQIETVNEDQAADKLSSAKVQETSTLLNQASDFYHMNTSDLLTLCGEAYIDMSNNEDVEAQIAVEVSASAIQIDDAPVETSMDKTHVHSAEDSGFMEKSYEEVSPRKKRNSRTTSGFESSTDDSSLTKNESYKKKRGRPVKNIPKFKLNSTDDSPQDSNTSPTNCLPEKKTISDDVNLKRKKASKRRSKSTTNIPDSPYFKSSKVDKDSSVKIVLHKSKSELSLTHINDQNVIAPSADKDSAQEQTPLDANSECLNIDVGENLDKLPVIENTGIQPSSDSDLLPLTQTTLNSIDLVDSSVSLEASKDDEVIQVQDEVPKMKIKLSTTLSLENVDEPAGDSIKNEVLTQAYQEKTEDILVEDFIDKIQTSSDLEATDKKNGNKVSIPPNDSPPEIGNPENILTTSDDDHLQICPKEQDEPGPVNEIVTSKKKSGRSQKKKKLADDSVNNDNLLTESPTLTAVNKTTDNQSQNRQKKPKKSLTVAETAVTLTDDGVKQNSEDNTGFKSRRCRKIIDYNEENLVKQALGEAVSQIDPTKKSDAIKENKRPKEHNDVTSQKASTKVTVPNKTNDSMKTEDTDETSLKVNPKTQDFEVTTDVKPSSIIENNIQSSETSKPEESEEKPVEETPKISKGKKLKKISIVKEVEKADAVTADLIPSSDIISADKDVRNRRIRKTINYNEDNLEKSLIEKAIMESEVSKKASKKKHDRVATNSKDTKNESVTTETSQHPVLHKADTCKTINYNEDDLEKNLIEKTILELEASKKASKKKHDRITTSPKDTKNDSGTDETNQHPVLHKVEECKPISYNEDNLEQNLIENAIMEPEIFKKTSKKKHDRIPVILKDTKNESGIVETNQHPVLLKAEECKAVNFSQDNLENSVIEKPSTELETSKKTSKKKHERNAPSSKDTQNEYVEAEINQQPVLHKAETCKIISYNGDDLEKNLIEKTFIESEVSKKASKKKHDRVATNSKGTKNESGAVETNQLPVLHKTEECAPKDSLEGTLPEKNDNVSLDVSSESVVNTPVDEKKRKKRSRSVLRTDDNAGDGFNERVQDLISPDMQQSVKDTESRKPKKPKNNMDLDISNILDLYDSSDIRRSFRTRKSLALKTEDAVNSTEKEKQSDSINNANKASETNDKITPVASQIFENLNKLVLMEDDILEDKLLVPAIDLKSVSKKAKTKKHKSDKDSDITPSDSLAVEDDDIPKPDTLLVNDVALVESGDKDDTPLTIPMDITPPEETFSITKPKKSKSKKSKSMIFLNICEIFDGTLDISKPENAQKEETSEFSELPLNDIITSSEMDIAPVLDEIDKSLESEDIYEFADQSNKTFKGKQNKSKTKSKVTEERPKRSNKTKALENIYDKTSDMETDIGKISDIVNENKDQDTEEKSHAPLENALDRPLTDENALSQHSEDASKAEQSQMIENSELRRSRRGSRKVASYNENDLIDPLIDALEKRRSHVKKDKSTEKSKKEVIKDDSDNLKTSKPPSEAIEHHKTSKHEDNNVSLPKRREDHIQDCQEESDDLGQEKIKDIDKIYEFTEDSPENTGEIRELFSKTKKRFQPKRDSVDSESVVNTTDTKKTKADEKTKDDQEQSKTNYCDICKKYFIRMENLVKHKTTLTHISKLSELEAREAEKKAREHSEEIEKEIDTPTPQPMRVDIDITDILQQPEAPTVELEKQVPHTNTRSVNLVDIISHVLNKPVLETYTSSKASYPDVSKSDVRQYKSLAERKSFDADSQLSAIDVQYIHPVISKTSILEKQINLLENIIGSNLEKTAVNEIPEPTNNFIDDISSCSNNSYVSNPSVSNENSELISEANNVHSDFVKPTQYEEISLDSTLAREDPKLRKILNRDEELFLECCSLLKSGSEVSNSNYPKNCKQKPDVHPVEVDDCDWVQGNKLIQRSEEAHEYSDNSRTPTPLGDTYDDDASNSNTISSNWNLNSEKPPAENRSFSFEEVISKEEHESQTGISFGEMLTKGLKNQFESSPNFPSRTPLSSLTPNFSNDEKKDDSDCSTASRKIITKGARKVFEGLKVSIPTEELNLDLINQSPLNKKMDIERAIPEPQVISPPPKPRSTRKSKPVKKSQVGSNLFFKVNKKKASPKPPAIQNERHDMYNFEETQCKSDSFVKTSADEVKSKAADVNKYLSDNDSLDYTDSNGADARSLSTVSSVSALSFKKPEIAPENIPKKKCMIMGKIFKNAAKSKMDEIDEELRNIPEIPEIDNLEKVENYVLSCQNISSPLPPPIFQQPLQEVPKKPKMTEEEMNLLFDKLLGKEAAENSIPVKAVKPIIKPSAPRVPKSDKPTDPKKKCTKSKNRKRTRVNSESSDDEFNISKTIRKRSNKKNNDDSGINLELELKECIGVASRKSQRKCTSGKQNVLVEYWSSDEDAFEAMLESQKVQPGKEEERKKADIEMLEVPEKLPDMIADPVKENTGVKPIKTKQIQRKKLLTHKKSKIQNRKPQDSNSSYSSSTSNRRKRAAVNPLYHWSSSSEDESQSLIEIKPIREEDDDEEERPVQHGWIVGDSPKKLVTMLALTKGKKTEVDSVKEQGKRRASNTVS